MKKGFYFGLLMLSALSLASCGHQTSAADKAASAKAASSRTAASEASASSQAASLKLKRVIASSAKKEAESASRESIAAASSSKAASESDAQAALAKAQSESAEAASKTVDSNALPDLPESVATGTQVTSLAQAVSLVQSKLGTGNADNPITWTTMTAGSDTFEGDDGQAYYWIRGIRQASLAAQKKAGAGSADGLDYYVYQNGLIRSRDTVEADMMADD